ncbi:MAG: type II toxin-antitoxin system RelE/ParE family toxin [Deltaproteobacteria bacterium]|nr:type II toxin-antitoxin system RelE/ParE family toxin [Nannocystaceae bacterium]
MKRLVLTAEARLDALEAYRFYEERRPGLGTAFRDHLDVAVATIRRDPERWPVVYRDLRRKLVARFPYSVFYRVHPRRILVVAVMHARRNPRMLIRRSEGTGEP